MANCKVLCTVGDALIQSFKQKYSIWVPIWRCYTRVLMSIWTQFFTEKSQFRTNLFAYIFSHLLLLIHGSKIFEKLKSPFETLIPTKIYISFDSEDYAFAHETLLLMRRFWSYNKYSRPPTGAGLQQNVTAVKCN